MLFHGCWMGGLPKTVYATHSSHQAAISAIVRASLANMVPVRYVDRTRWQILLLSLQVDHYTWFPGPYTWVIIHLQLSPLGAGCGPDIFHVILLRRLRTIAHSKNVLVRYQNSIPVFNLLSTSQVEKCPHYYLSGQICIANILTFRDIFHVILLRRLRRSPNLLILSS